MPRISEELLAGPRSRGRALICGDCWADLRADQYEPETRDPSQDCSRCGQYGGQHRVSWAELDHDAGKHDFNESQFEDVCRVCRDAFGSSRWDWPK